MACGHEGVTHSGLCTKCGHEGTGRVAPVLASNVDPAETLALAKTRAFFDMNPITLVLTISLTIGSPLLGLLIGSWTGGLVGVALSVFCMVIGIQALTRFREKWRGG